MKVLKNLAAVLVGLFCSLLLLGCFEIFFRLNQEFKWMTPPAPNYGWMFSRDEEASKVLKKEVSKDLARIGWTPRFSEEQGRRMQFKGTALKGHLPTSVWSDHEQKKARQFQSRVLGPEGEEIYSVRMTIDKAGRRVTPDPRVLRSRILMFGDSFTLGEGVEDWETSPWVLGKKRPQTKVYNFGVAGGGPNDCLYELQSDRAGRLEDIGPSKEPTIVLYTFIDHHMERLLGRSSSVLPDNEWILSKPYYQEIDGEAVLVGGMKESRVLFNAFSRFFHSSAIVEFFNLVLPPVVRESDYALFGKVVKAMQESAVARFGAQTKFYLVIFPEGRVFHAGAVKRAAEKEGVSVLDYQRIDVPFVVGGLNVIPGDGHPAPPTQAIFAHLLDRDLPRF